MTPRLDPAAITPDLYKAYFAFSQSRHKGALPQTLRHLVDIRASQLNGCAFCVDMHVKEATIHGERPLRLHHLAIWRESPLFDARERAALAWTEAVTRLGEHGVADDVYDEARLQFSDAELSELTFAVVAINGWNRLSVAFRRRPGTMDTVLGLDKAGLS
jgi:AhpD family alkylhydroperoxidase